MSEALEEIVASLEEGAPAPSLEELQAELEDHQMELARARRHLASIQELVDSAQERYQATRQWQLYQEATIAYNDTSARANRYYSSVRDLALQIFERSGLKKIGQYVSVKVTKKYEIVDPYRALCWALQREYRAMMEDLEADREYHPKLVRLDDKAFLETSKFYLEGMERGVLDENTGALFKNMVGVREMKSAAVATDLSKLLEE